MASQNRERMQQQRRRQQPSLLIRNATSSPGSAQQPYSQPNTKPTIHSKSTHKSGQWRRTRAIRKRDTVEYDRNINDVDNLLDTDDDMGAHDQKRRKMSSRHFQDNNNLSTADQQTTSVPLAQLRPRQSGNSQVRLPSKTQGRVIQDTQANNNLMNHLSSSLPQLVFEKTIPVAVQMRQIQGSIQQRVRMCQVLENMLSSIPTAATTIDWTSILQPEEYLGGGAYGHVYSYRLRSDNMPCEVAIKVIYTSLKRLSEEEEEAKTEAMMSINSTLPVGDLVMPYSSNTTTTLGYGGRVTDDDNNMRQPNRPTMTIPMDMQDDAIPSSLFWMPKKRVSSASPTASRGRGPLEAPDDVASRMHEIDFDAAMLEIKTQKLVSSLVESNVCPHFALFIRDAYEVSASDYGNTVVGNDECGSLNSRFILSSRPNTDTTSLSRNHRRLRPRRCGTTTVNEKNSAGVTVVARADVENDKTRSIHIVMEKCDESLHDWLVRRHQSTVSIMSMMFQVCMGVCWMGVTYKMVHNDLFTRNIMCSRVDRRLVHRYVIGRNHFRVPLCGYLWKVMDYSLVTSPTVLKRPHKLEFSTGTQTHIETQQFLSCSDPARHYSLKPYLRDLMSLLWSIVVQNRNHPMCIPPCVVEWATGGIQYIETVESLSSLSSSSVDFVSSPDDMVRTIVHLFSPSTLGRLGMPANMFAAQQQWEPTTTTPRSLPSEEVFILNVPDL